MSTADWLAIGRMDELARMDTPAHRLDARAKGVVTLAFVAVVMSFPRREVSALTPLALYPLALIAAGRIPAWDILKKVLVAAPFAVAVGLFNPFLDREPVAAVGPFVLTGGWLSFASILLRFALTVAAALALVACTGMYRLGAGLEQLGLPRAFVTQLLFLHRYLFVVAEQGFKLMRGVALRSGGVRRLPLRAYGSLTGHLLLRSMDRAERVYRAMRARGFDGQIRLLHRPSCGSRDWVFVCGFLCFFLAARTWNLAAGLGALFVRILP